MTTKAWKTLQTTDKQVAQKKAAEFLRDKERELHGLIPPQSVRDAAARPLLFQLSEFVSDLSAQGRDSMYIYNVERRVRKLLADCGWISASQISADGFQRWRSTHRDKAPKTLNDYQDALAGFLKWLVRNNRKERNVLDGVPKAQTRGKARRRRRAFAVHELNGLVMVAGDRKLGYLLAALTGLRRAELKALQWGDVHLEADSPFIAVRDSTSKNAQRAEIPLHPQLTKALCEAKPEAVGETQPVLCRHHLASMWMLRKDLKSAGIPFVDVQGRRADFHALRGTFNMLMALRNIDPQTRKLAMRHSDIKLTANTYMDGTLLPLTGAIHALPWLGDSAPERAPAADTLCPNSALSVTIERSQMLGEELVNALHEHEVARNGTTGHNAENGCLARIRT